MQISSTYNLAVEYNNAPCLKKESPHFALLCSTPICWIFVCAFSWRQSEKRYMCIIYSLALRLHILNYSTRREFCGEQQVEECKRIHTQKMQDRSSSRKDLLGFERRLAMSCAHERRWMNVTKVDKLELIVERFGEVLLQLISSRSKSEIWSLWKENNLHN